MCGLWVKFVYPTQLMGVIKLSKSMIRLLNPLRCSKCSDVVWPSRTLLCRSWTLSKILDLLLALSSINIRFHWNK